MSIVIKSKCVDTKEREDAELRRQTRRQEDIRNGLIKVNAGPQRGDFKICQEGDRFMRDYRNHKDPKSREKIKKEYFQMQSEHRGK